MARIRTPDQRLRVFVSSTLKEMAAERKTARAAIEQLHLAPVMFELGARPHPPRQLYRAYLEQSDVFVGLYWERYGWVAPGEEVSGLEDEYNLSGVMPKLIYIKETAGQREERLMELLDRIRTDDRASFSYVADSRDVGRLLRDDLAILLAERFDQSNQLATASPTNTISRPPVRPLPEPAPEPLPRPLPRPLPEPLAEPPSLPVTLTETIGRAQECATIERMLRDRSLRLITLTGPGGIGKSRLAVAVASRVHDVFADGIVFVDLSPVDHASGVIIAIAAALGVRDTGDGPLEAKVATALQHQSKLLIVDNFEQVVDAAPVLTTMLAAAPGVTVLVTSRIVLRVSGEQSFEVGPLSLPTTTRGSPVDAALRSDAVRLFVERAHAVKPDFELTESNAAAVVQICVALDGVPLALELAAARVRLLPPAAMLDRLDHKLPLLVGGVRDLPARQKTLRSTIEWSTALLGPDEQELLTRLGVFAGTFSLDAVEYLYRSRSDVDVLALLGSLVDSSLIRQLDRGERSHFSMLATVREYAVECLQAQHILDEVREQHASYFIELAQTAEAHLDGSDQRAWIRALTDDADNLRAAERYLLDTEQFTRAADFAWSLYLFWWVGGYLGEVRGWMDELLSRGTTLSPTTRAIALYFTQAITFWQDPDGRVIPGLTESAELFRAAHKPRAEALTLVSLALAHLSASPPDPHTAEQSLSRALSLFQDDGDRWGEAMTLVTMGRVDLLQQKIHGALNRFDESLALTAQQRDELGSAIAHHHRGWAHLILGSAETAQQSFENSLEMSVRLDHQEGIAYGLEGLVAIAAATGDTERSGVLLGAAEGLREQTGLYNTPRFSFHQPFVDALLAGTAAVQFEQARTHGREMTVADAVKFAERV